MNKAVSGCTIASSSDYNADDDDDNDDDGDDNEGDGDEDKKRKVRRNDDYEVVDKVGGAEKAESAKMYVAEKGRGNGGKGRQE